MNPNRLSLQKAAEALQSVSSGAICLPENPSIDAIAAGTALYLGLTQSEKNVSLICSDKINSDLVATDKFRTALTTSGDNLVVSFPYVDGSVEKVDWMIQNEKFNVVITPSTGFPKLDPKQVEFGYSGGTVEFIITIDAPNLRSLGGLFTENKEQFKGKKIINIDRHLANGFYGTVNIVSRSISSASELVLTILRSMNVEIDKNIATNLYRGIVSATNNFTSQTTNAETLENAAFLLKAGAKKQVRFPAVGRIGNIEKQAGKPIEEIEREEDDFENGGMGGQEESEEWLKPKIFKKPSDLL